RPGPLMHEAIVPAPAGWRHPPAHRHAPPARAWVPAYTGGVPSPTILTAAQAARRAEAHAAAVAQRTQAHLDRRSRGEAHPVEDFLYTYYPFTPGQLSTWHPGAGVAVEAEATESDAADSFARALA